LNTIYVTAWPEEGIPGCSWSKTKEEAVTKRISPSFKIVEFTPELTQEDIEKGVALFKVNLHKEGSISFDHVSCKVVNGIIEEIEGATNDLDPMVFMQAIPVLYIVADVEEDTCYGKWLSGA
jgi:hypothetical protein